MDNYMPNNKDWRIFLISLIFMLIVVYVCFTLLMDVLLLQIGLLGKIFLVFVTFEFLFRRIIIPLSEKLILIYKAIELKTGLKGLMEDLVPEEDKEIIEEENKRALNRLMEKAKKEKKKEELLRRKGLNKRKRK